MSLRQFRHLVVCCMLFILALTAVAQSPLRVGDFSTWQLSSAPGRQNPDQSIAVTGNGNSCNYWLSRHLELLPGRVYKYKVSARRLNGTGCAITGPLFCNVDENGLGGEWQTVENCFAALSDTTDPRSVVRLGQWHLNGTVEYKDFRILPVIPIYNEEQGIELGADEKISVNEYIFTPLFEGMGRNHSRPLFMNNACFNTSRWVFWQNNRLTYRFNVRGRQQLRAKVTMTVHYHKRGRMIMEASTDNRTWRPVATADGVGSIQAELPAELFPADVVYLRISAQSNYDAGILDSDPGAFQFNAFSYKASLSGPPLELVGSTRYLEVLQNDPKLDVTIHGMGEALPGGKNAIDLTVVNHTQKDIPLAPQVILTDHDGKDQVFNCAKQLLGAGNTARLTLPYDIGGTGKWRIMVVLGGNSPYAVATDCTISDFFNTSYGSILCPSDGTAAVWCASSAWKIPRLRRLPTARSSALEIRAARHEAEAAQLVVTPEKDLVDLQATASKFQSADGRILPADMVEILRVYYHDVQLRTDSSSIIGYWPDALPPLRKGIGYPAHVNHPLWIRVTVPANAAAGVYSGTITLHDATGWRKQVPVRLTVYDFDMPEDMTCETGFGLYVDYLWKYHKPGTEAEKRKILDSYLTTLAKHHISPYNPAPLDPWTATLTGADATWKNLTRVPDQPEAGNTAAAIADDSTTSQKSLEYGAMLPVGNGALTVRFRYKTGVPAQEIMVTAGCYDANQQWIRGRNKDIILTGDGSWQNYSCTLNKFSKDTRFIRLILRPTRWTEQGERTGTAMFADLEVVDDATGAVLVKKDTFRQQNLHNLNIQFDWKNWDAAVERAFNHYHFCALRFAVNGLGSGTFHSRVEPSLFGFKEGTPEYDVLIKKYLNGIQQHLAEKGWLRRAYVYWFDEPDPKDYEFVMNGFKKLKTHAPGIRRLLTEQVEPELLGGPDVWCPVSNNALKTDVTARRAAGEDFWWYVCTGPKAPYATLFIDHPGIEMRVWLWQTWDFGIQGILVWCANLWSSPAAYPDSLQNPYLDPMGWVTGYGLPKGTRRAWGNGDGRFVYPPEAAADGTQPQTVLDKPVDSIRLEMLRDGIEDYEYFVMLKRLIDTKAEKLTDEELDAFKKLLVVPKNVSRSLTDFAVDPVHLEAHREKLARAIEILNKR